MVWKPSVSPDFAFEKKAMYKVTEKKINRQIAISAQRYNILS